VFGNLDVCNVNLNGGGCFAELIDIRWIDMGALYLSEETNDFWLLRLILCRLFIIFTALKHFLKLYQNNILSLDTHEQTLKKWSTCYFCYL
jgi:hypothetical protein